MTPEIEPAGWPRTLWAGISALLGTACLGAWWSLRPRRSPAPTHGREEVTPEPKASDRARAHTLGREPGASATRRAGPAAWSLAGLCMAVVLHGALSHLATHNHERLTAPVTGCATQPLAVAGPIVLRPGQPFDTSPRRDGDFVLQGSLQLEPDSLLDVLFRAEPATRDRGLIAGLSTCAEVPCDTVLNLGTALSRRPGPGPLRADEPHALSIVCRGARSVVSVDGTELGTLSSYDLRAGRIALHALRGGATLRDLSIVPAEVPVDTGPVLRRWLMLVGGSLLGGSLLLLLLARGSPAAWIWLLPLAVALAPAAPRAALTPGLLLAALLLLATPALRPGRLAWAPAWALGAGMLCVASWAVTEAPPEFSPNLLSRLDLTDVTGGSLPARQLWARHPLTRKFNGWLRDQTLRGQPVSQTPFPGVPRVIALGSSSTYGYGVEADQAWPAQLADLLSGHGRPVEVLNAGVPNGTARRLLPFLRDALLDLSPDLVIVSLSFNDHIELALNHERDHFDAMTGAGVGWFDQQLARWSRRQARRRWQDYFGQVLHGESPDAELTGRCVLEPARRFEQTLEEMAAAAAARGVALVLMKEPPRDPLQPGLIGVYHAAMDALGQRLGLPVADPKPTLDAAGGELFLDAIHPNPRGHAIVAEVLARTVREARMLGR